MVFLENRGAPELITVEVAIYHDIYCERNCSRITLRAPAVAPARSELEPVDRQDMHQNTSSLELPELT